ncbi:MAG: pyridoxamine 5'-phosphate oxidase family protein [Planctomycetota bacterium]
MASPDSWHEGELHFQRLAGVPDSNLMRRAIMKTMPPVAMEFISRQELAAFGTVDESGTPYAWVVAGPAGFLRAPTSDTLQLSREALEALDPLFEEQLRLRPEIGTIVLEPRTRRRMRINGRAAWGEDRQLVITASEVFSNCPKYIQTREPATPWSKPPKLERGQTRSTLNATDLSLIERVDTFFIASRHSEAGVDISHRGGRPGFLRAVGASRLRFPDYSGNNMFQTLGNLFVDDRAGLALLDFEGGALLQVEGRAFVTEDPELVASFAGARRVVELEVWSVTRSEWAGGASWTLGEFSPALPPESVG